MEEIEDEDSIRHVSQLKKKGTVTMEEVEDEDSNRYISQPPSSVLDEASQSTTKKNKVSSQFLILTC